MIISVSVLLCWCVDDIYHPLISPTPTPTHSHFLIFVVQTLFHLYGTQKQMELFKIRRKKQVALQAEQLSAHKFEIEKLLKETESKMQNV